jgi:hypothetical protein
MISVALDSSAVTAIYHVLLAVMANIKMHVVRQRVNHVPLVSIQNSIMKSVPAALVARVAGTVSQQQEEQEQQT